MKTKALIVAIILCMGMLVFSGCQGKAREDIIVLYTNDVHCGIEEDIGYSGLASYKAFCLEKTPFVTLVDCGDAVQGDLIGTVSDGEYIVELMNSVGYDLAIPGNHEFDYGTEQLAALIGESKATYLSCNITYTGTGENKLSALAPYKIVDYGDVSVAFIGVTAPRTITSSTPAYFMENGEFVYNFCSESGEALYSQVQSCVDECQSKGADYIIVLSHLGDNMKLSPFTSVELIANTSGIDAVLDGHSHSTVSCRIEADKDGNSVLLSQAGTKLENIGQLVITASGNITAGLVSEYAARNGETDEYIKQLKATYEETMNEVVAKADIALSCFDENGLRLVRCRETAIGDLCADAYRTASGADIAFVNGGGIRADLPSGDITYADIIAVHPYGNSLCMVKATGQEILDCLEMGCCGTESKTSENGKALGEFGGFQQVSGIKFKIDTSVPSGVVLDANGLFASVNGARRVSDVSVQNADGSYTPLDPQKTYTLASHNYMLKNNGDGMSMFSDNELVIDEGTTDYQMLIDYITDTLGGSLKEKYAAPEGRITVK